MSIPPIVQPTLARPLHIDPILERDKSTYAFVSQDYLTSWANSHNKKVIT